MTLKTSVVIEYSYEWDIKEEPLLDTLKLKLARYANNHINDVMDSIKGYIEVEREGELLYYYDDVEYKGTYKITKERKRVIRDIERSY